MPRSEKITAAQAVVSEASTVLTLDLVKELSEPLADYDTEDWQDSSLVEALARVAALLEVNEREVPGSIMAALRSVEDLALVRRIR